VAENADTDETEVTITEQTVMHEDDLRAILECSANSTVPLSEDMIKRITESNGYDGDLAIDVYNLFKVDVEKGKKAPLPNVF
jgi:hypothetical protein